MDRYPYDIQAAVSTTHTSCFRQILNPLFDLYYVLEIITFGNYNGLDAGPLTLLSPYILSLVNANGPTDAKDENLHASSPCLPRSLYVLLMTSQSVGDDVIMKRQLWREHVTSDI